MTSISTLGFVTASGSSTAISSGPHTTQTSGYVDRPVAGAEETLGFDTLTFAPIDRKLIVKDMLSPGELAWLNAYHAQVVDKIGPQLDDEERRWLEAACAPL